MQWERVKLEHLGRGGTSDDVALVDEVESALAYLAERVTDDQSKGPAKLTISIKLEKTGEGAVAISYFVKLSEPARRRKGLAAVIGSDGALLAAGHRQEALPLGDAPIRLRPTAEGEEI